MDPRFREDDEQKRAAERNREAQQRILRRILLHCKLKRPPLRRASIILPSLSTGKTNQRQRRSIVNSAEQP